jgi:hypothetical protein
MQRASKLRKAAYKKAKENQRNLMLAAAIAGTAGVGYGAHRYRKRSRVPTEPIDLPAVRREQPNYDDLEQPKYHDLEQSPSFPPPLPPGEQ